MVKFARVTVLGVLTLVFAGTNALAQKFPAGPVRIVAPYVPGGAVDIVARPLADLLSQRWGSPVVVENRAGGATVVGTSVVASAPADGHTLLLTATPFLVNPTLLPSLPYDSLRDFAGVSMVVEQPLALVAHPSVPAKTLKELVAYASKSEQPLAYGSSGIGGISHLFGELFARTAGIKLLHVPYRGSGGAVVDVLAGNIPLLFDSGFSAKSSVDGGGLKVIAVSSRQRLPELPNVPTFAEDYPGFEFEQHPDAARAGRDAPAGDRQDFRRRPERHCVARLCRARQTGRPLSQGLHAAGAGCIHPLRNRQVGKGHPRRQHPDRALETARKGSRRRIVVEKHRAVIPGRAKGANVEP